MFNWILIIILVLAAFLIIRFMFSRHAKHRFKLTIILVVVLLLISSFYFVSYYNNIDITNIKGLGQGFSAYGVWILHSFSNFRTLTGYAVGLDWKGNNVSTNNTPDNISLIDNGKKASQEIVNITVNGVNSVLKPNTPKPITTYK